MADRGTPVSMRSTMQARQLDKVSSIGGTALARSLLCLVSLVACAQPAAMIVVTVNVTAGPVCPVVRDPPDPACSDRPVDGAVLVFLGPDGRNVTTASTDSAGRASVALPAGRYTVRPQPVHGLMGTPRDIPLVVDGSTPALTISYDTGIR
jgi:hypothetical protein